MEAKERNIARVTGKIISDLVYSHTCRGNKYYATKIEVIRKSGTADIINVIIRENLISGVKADRYVEIKGEFRERMSEKHLNLYLFVKDILIVNCNSNYNGIELTGFIVSKPTYRTTPLGRKVADVVLAINRRRGNTDYIPCIVWGKYGERVGNMNIGDEITISGRMQSRDYQKPNETFTRTAYEVSARYMIPTGNNNRKEVV